MEFKDFYQILDECGQVVVQKDLLMHLQKEIEQTLDQYPFAMLEDKSCLAEFYLRVTLLKKAIVTLNLQAGLIPCSMPSCNNIADVSTTLGVSFCKSCNKERLAVSNCGE